MPAFSGLFAPYWRSDARGAIVGLTRYVNKGHIARAVLEATAFQTREVLDAMNADSGVDLTALKVDGGMVANETLMQFQADILGVPVIRPVVAETTALGAAYAAGLAVGFWASEDDIRTNWAEDKRWEPQMDDARPGQAVPEVEEGRHQDLRLGATRTTEPALHRERTALSYARGVRECRSLQGVGGDQGVRVQLRVSSTARCQFSYSDCTWAGSRDGRHWAASCQFRRSTCRSGQ